MKRDELEEKILNQHPQVKLINLKHLSKLQLENWVSKGEIGVTTEQLVKIFIERNQRAEINQKLNNENFSLTAKLYLLSSDLTNWSKSEIIHGFKTLFGKVTKADDKLLREIGAVSKETAKEDLDKAEQIIDDAKDVAEQYVNKYGKI